VAAIKQRLVKVLELFISHGLNLVQRSKGKTSFTIPLQLNVSLDRLQSSHKCIFAGVAAKKQIVPLIRVLETYLQGQRLGYVHRMNSAPGA